MKKIFYIVICVAVSFITSCTPDLDLKTYKENLPPGGQVKHVLVSPSKQSLFVDSDLPELSAICVPEDASDLKVVWSSDHPEILKVDPETGELSWGTVSNAEVTITATSVTNPEAKGTCVFDIVNAAGMYQFVDLTSQIGLYVMDRNLGATEPYTKQTASADVNYALRGNFYHWGLNKPAANFEFGGANGRGYEDDPYVYPNGKTVRGGYKDFAYNGWFDTDPRFVDWSNVDNQPVPRGWRLPTKEDLEKIVACAAITPSMTEKQKAKARLFRQKIAIAPSGYIRIGWGNWDWQHGYIWSSTRDPETKKVWVLKVTEATSWNDKEWSVELMDISFPAIVIRCVRDKGSSDK